MLTIPVRVPSNQSTPRPSSSRWRGPRSWLRSRSDWELEKDFGELLALAPPRSTRAMAWDDLEKLERQMDRMARQVASQPGLLPRVERFLNGWSTATSADRRWSVQMWRKGASRVVETVYTPPPNGDLLVELEDWGGWPWARPTIQPSDGQGGWLLPTMDAVAPHRFSHGSF